MKVTTSVFAVALAAAAVALAASSAFALPEVGRCVATPGGKYKDSNCDELAHTTPEKQFAFVKEVSKPNFHLNGATGAMKLVGHSRFGPILECESGAAFTGELHSTGTTPS